MRTPAPYAANSLLATTRHPRQSEKVRGVFQRDRDRIMYSNAFRRLNGKTQVFMALSNDHIRTRLTHSLEVSQIAKTIAFKLGLDGVLIEAIALGHDLGHTPFGHVGERALNFIMNDCARSLKSHFHIESGNRGFKHNLQSVRVCDRLESRYSAHQGLNLSNFTLWGIVDHSSRQWKRACQLYSSDTSHCRLTHDAEPCQLRGTLSVDFYDAMVNETCTHESGEEAWSLEAFVVGIADEIAQRHHDIEDGFFAGVLRRDDTIELIESILGESAKAYDAARTALARMKDESNRENYLPYASKVLVDIYVSNLIETSLEKLEKLDIRLGQVYEPTWMLETSVDAARNLVSFSPELAAADNELQLQLKSRILNSFAAQRMDGRGQYIIRKLFEAYISNPNQLHNRTIWRVFSSFRNSEVPYSARMRDELVDHGLRDDPTFHNHLVRAICDHIAGMTDQFVIEEYRRLYGIERSGRLLENGV